MLRLRARFRWLRIEAEAAEGLIPQRSVDQAQQLDPRFLILTSTSILREESMGFGSCVCSTRHALVLK